MTTAIRRWFAHGTLIATIALLSACGGGSGGEVDGSSPPASSPPPPPAAPPPRTGSAPPARPGQFLLFEASEAYAGDHHDTVYKYDLDSDTVNRLSPPLVASVPVAMPLVSPDGQWLAYVANDGNLYVTQADGSGGSTLLTTSVPGRHFVSPEEIQWSPDGSRIAFGVDIASRYDDSVVYESYREIYFAQRDGGNLRKVSAEVADPKTADELVEIKWSADGLHFAFRVISQKAPDVWVGSSIDVVDASTAERTRIVMPMPPAANGIELYEWAPDGSRIAYLGYGNGAMGLFTGRPGASTSLKVSADADGSVGGVFAWSPDSSRLAYVGGLDSTGAGSLFTVHPDGTGLAKIEESVARVGVPAFSWAPDASRIAWLAPENGNALYVARPDGTEPLKLSDATSADDHVWEVKWAGDSSRLAYRLVHAAAASPEVFLVRADGSGSFKVDAVFQGGTRDFPSKGYAIPSAFDFDWSPDSSRLAFIGARGSAAVELFTVRPDTNEYFKLNDPLPAGINLTYAKFAWSADGSRIAYRDLENGGNIEDVHVISPNGATYRNLSSAFTSATNAVVKFTWSP